jgi:membrane-associated protease RseP (regulator of RpoE activity)
LEFIAPGDVITHINGERLIYLEDFFSAMSKTKPYENATVVTDKGEFVITLGNNTDYKSRGFLNVRPKSDPTFNNFMPELVTGKLSGDYLWLFSIIKWIFIYNLLVGMFNLLPVPVFDGHGVYRNIFSWVEESVSWGKKRKLGKILLRGLMLILLSVLLLNFFPFFAADIQGSIIMLAVFTAFILLSAKFRRSSSRKSRKK